MLPYPKSLGTLGQFCHFTDWNEVKMTDMPVQTSAHQNESSPEVLGGVAVALLAFVLLSTAATIDHSLPYWPWILTSVAFLVVTMATKHWITQSITLFAGVGSIFIGGLYAAVNVGVI